MASRLAQKHSLIRSAAGLERRPFAECLGETAALISSLGYGPRIVAASILQYEDRAAPLPRHGAVFDADITSLLLWAQGGLGRAPRLRFAPGAALTILVARHVVNLRSLASLSEGEVRHGLLDTIGWEPLSLPLSEAIRAFQLLANYSREKVPLRIWAELHDLIAALEMFARWLEPPPEAAGDHLRSERSSRADCSK